MITYIHSSHRWILKGSIMKLAVAILMGSDSDWPTMKKAAETLKEFGIESESRVLSAHRAPEEVAAFAKAADQKFSAIIAGAGGAAHLAGVLAGHTTLPIIAVPIETKLAGGLDSLLSMVQMPKGIPVATVGVGNATNAALLAIRMLSVGNPDIKKKLEAYHLEQKKKTNG